MAECVETVGSITLTPFFREAGPVHVPPGTEAAARPKLDRFDKKIRVDGNRHAIQLPREADIFVEARFSGCSHMRSARDMTDG